MDCYWADVSSDLLLGEAGFSTINSHTTRREGRPKGRPPDAVRLSESAVDLEVRRRVRHELVV
jgi:hypothetical protein